MIFKQIACGGDRNFSYLIGDAETGEGALVDPAYGVDMLLQSAEDNGLKITTVINTHGHGDHTGGNNEVAAKTGARIAAHPSLPGIDIPLDDNTELAIGSCILKVIHTPGHTVDSLCILIEDAICTGDTLFVGKVGGTIDEASSQAEYDSLHNRLMVLDPAVRVYPGHNYGLRPVSTIGDEAAENPFIKQPSFEAFIGLKLNWAAYKQEHGIA